VNLVPIMRFASVRINIDRLRTSPAWWSWPVEVIALITLAYIVHVAMLAWIYPGFYDPFWPHHSDYYIGAALAHSPISYLQYLTVPRPVGALFLEITGHLGVRCAIAANLFLVFLNCTITAMFLRRVGAFRLTWSFWIGFSLFLFLVFSHPLQYVWSTYDVFSQLSYFLLACAVMLGLRGVGIPVLFGFFVLAFLAKETFALSALFLIALWWMLGHSSDRLRAVRVAGAMVLALGITLILNRINQSQFLGSGAVAGSPYQIDFSAYSLASEWMRYAIEGMSLGAWAFVGAVAIVLVIHRHALGAKLGILAVALPVAGMLAWLPNSAIPNHHYSGYSFNGSYLIFAPALFLGTLWTAGRWMRGFLLVISILALITPALSASRYAANGWMLEQQHRQKLLLLDLGRMLRQLPPNTHSVLVTGMDFPFSPFDHGLSLLSLRDLGSTRFSVVTYVPRDGSTHAFPLLSLQPTSVQFVTPETALHGNFDEIWMFRNNGSLIRSIHIGKDATPAATLGFTPLELMIFPGVAESLGVAAGTGGNLALLNDGYRLLNCGTALVTYQQPALALRCLEASIRKIPENPYPYYFSGIALEQLNRIDEAKLFFEKAVFHDDTSGPNPAFKEALQRSEKHASTRPVSNSNKD
jgi:tetratricopeptide (TPR) repeat protein